MTEMNGDEAVKQARRAKIKQLEASLFENGERGSRSLGNSDVLTGLPELQKVNEYADSFGAAERRKNSALPSLKKQAMKKIFFPDPRKKTYSRLKSPGGFSDDEEGLLDSSGGSSKSSKETSWVNLLPSPLQTPNSEPRSTSRPSSRRASSNTLLKSEVEELDASIRHLVKDPKEEVLDKIRKKHGMPRSPSVDSAITSEVDSSARLKNVSPKVDLALGRATILDQEVNRPTSVKASAKTRRQSLDSNKVLSDDRAAIDAALEKLHSNRKMLDAHLEKDNLNPEWPSMPEIKASLPIKGGGRKDVLLPLARNADQKSPKEKKKKGSKKMAVNRSMSSYDQGEKISGSMSFGEGLSKSAKLPSIGSQPSLNNPPMIKIDSSTRTRREPGSERRGSLDTKLKMTRKDRDTPEMISFDGLEMPFDIGPSNVFNDVPDALHDVEKNKTFHDLHNNRTFDDIPSNVFDAIPFAVTEREVARLRRREEQRIAAVIAIDDATGGKEHPTRKDDNHDLVSHSTTTLSLITALFPGAQNARLRNAGQQTQEQLDSDFVLALVLQEQEQQQAHSSHQKDPQTTAIPSAQTESPEPEEDESPEIGHFCAPFCEGFCEANFCIFHNPRNPIADDEDSSVKPSAPQNF